MTPRRRLRCGRRHGGHHPCAGFVGTGPALIIGFAAGIICYLALSIKEATKLDDALDVIAVHLVGGIFGSIALGLFADSAVNEIIPDGLLLGGGTDLLVDQIVAVVAVFAFAFVVTYVIAQAIREPSACGSTRRPRTSASTGPHAETAYNNL